jgi:hypothetical protein
VLSSRSPGPEHVVHCDFQSSCSNISSTISPFAEPAPEGESDVYKKLHNELVRRGVASFRFHRVPGPYYEKPLEFRAQRLNAPSVDHLCKTMVMENTRAPEELLKIDDPRASKYFMVLVQYTSSIDAAKLGQFVHKVTSNSLIVFPSSFACLSFPFSVLFALLSFFWCYWGVSARNRTQWASLMDSTTMHSQLLDSLWCPSGV